MGLANPLARFFGVHQISFYFIVFHHVAIAWKTCIFKGVLNCNPMRRMHHASGRQARFKLHVYRNANPISPDTFGIFSYKTSPGLTVFPHFLPIGVKRILLTSFQLTQIRTKQDKKNVRENGQQNRGFDAENHIFFTLKFKKFARLLATRKGSAATRRNMPPTCPTPPPRRHHDQARQQGAT